MCLLTFLVSHFQSSEMKHILLRAMQWLTNVLTIPSPSVSDGRCWAAHACHACHVFTPWPTRPCRETSGIYLKEGYTLFCTQYNLILQASVCVPEECTLRGEVADLLAPVIQTMALQQQQQLMPASLGPGHAQAVARAGTLKPPTYCWMMRRERKNDFFYHFAGFTAVFWSPQCDQMCFMFPKNIFVQVNYDQCKQPLHPDRDQHI